ncbi:MAG: Aminodeoxyfutalosine deaminase, partial [Lacunisphaera sp.]|nr:Aminodeoxyfutalosine deaminase [Lacunisphaera sp.]
MRKIFLLLNLACLTSALAADFAARFEEIKRTAKPAELYTLLYALPKGGDLHNHSGSERPEWIYAVCTDPARNGGDTFYTRARFNAAPDAIAPDERFHNLRQQGYDQLPAEVRAEYVRLDALAPGEREAWCNSLRLDAPGEGRDEFFSVLWPRRGQIGSNLPVSTEVLVENIKAFGAEHLAYLETQFDVDRMTDNAGRLIA